MSTEREATPRRPHLVHEAYVSLLKRAEIYSNPDLEHLEWDAVPKYEKHAINAALDLQQARRDIDTMRDALREIAKACKLDSDYTETGARRFAEFAANRALAAIDGKDGGG